MSVDVVLNIAQHWYTLHLFNILVLVKLSQAKQFRQFKECNARCKDVKMMLKPLAAVRSDSYHINGVILHGVDAAEPSALIMLLILMLVSQVQTFLLVKHLIAVKQPPAL